MTIRKRPAELEARNEADYISLGKKIEDALIELASNRRLKATQDVLCGLAGCSRGTLANRVWPIARLEMIKNDRKKGAKGTVKPTKDDGRPPEPSLEERLQASRDEVLRWKEKHDAVATELDSTKKLLAEMIATVGRSTTSRTYRPAQPGTRQKVVAILSEARGELNGEG